MKEQVNKVIETENTKDFEVDLEQVGDKVVGGVNLKVTLVESPIGHTPKQRIPVAALGLRKVNQTATLPDSAAVRGQCSVVKHVV